ARYMNNRPCRACGGARLKKEALCVTVGGRAIHALTRLSIGKSFDGKGYRATRTDPSEAARTIREILKYGFENIRSKLKEEDYLRSRRSEPWRDALRPIDKDIFVHLRTLQEDQGIESVPRDSVMPGISPFQLEESLERLSRYGYVFLLKGGTLVKVVRIFDGEDMDG
ncbi:MAG: hypothetical protein ACMUHY_01585, partial [Thermoplasmatota archaeon]